MAKSSNSAAKKVADKAAKAEAKTARKAASKQRRSQLWQAFQMQRKEDKRLLPYMIGAFVVIVAASVAHRSRNVAVSTSAFAGLVDSIAAAAAAAPEVPVRASSASISSRRLENIRSTSRGMSTEASVCSARVV